MDVSSVLADDAIRPLMDAWRRENISLIRTIPQRLHEGPYRRMTDTFAVQPFDRQAMSRVLADKFGISGNNLRRIARDQTSKAIGQLTQARHRQIGIDEYVWRTAQDERVRASQAALDGSRQRYDSPPSVGNPGEDILCRCVAILMVDALDDGTRYPLRVEGAQTPISIASEPLPHGLASERFSSEAAARYAARTQTFTQHPDFIPHRSVASLHRYTGSAYQDFNRRLRERVPQTPTQREMQEGLRRLYQPLGEDTVTFRRLSGPIPFYRGAAVTAGSGLILS